MKSKNHMVRKLSSVCFLKKNLWNYIADIISKMNKFLVYSSLQYGTKSFKPCKLHRLAQGPPTVATVTQEEALKLYKQMLLMRRMEVACSNLYKAKKIRGFCHLYSGQEAVAVGMRSVMRDVDSAITSYRCHAWTYLMGNSGLIGVMAELTGTKSGVSRGKGGSMHLYERNFYGGNGIVGAQVPLGAGVAFAHKYRGDGGVAFTLYGDGAANQGQVFEAFNMAKLWNLPCAFVCENNGYAMGTSVERATPHANYYSRGTFLPGIWVDGMDVLATREATRFTIDHCSSGKGPIVLEMATYRYTGHSMSDPGTSYRSHEEVQQIRKTRDPIKNFKQKILEGNLVTDDQLKEMDTETRKEIDEAVAKLKDEVEVGTEELAGDVYVQSCHNTYRGCHPEAPLKPIAVAPRKESTFLSNRFLLNKPASSSMSECSRKCTSAVLNSTCIDK